MKSSKTKCEYIPMDLSPKDFRLIADAKERIAKSQKEIADYQWGIVHHMQNEIRAKLAICEIRVSRLEAMEGIAR